MLNVDFIQQKFDERGGRPAYAELAKHLRCSASVARLYVENLVSRPSVDVTYWLAQYLGVSIEDLLTEEFKSTTDSHKSTP